MITCITCGFQGDHIDILKHDCKPPTIFSKFIDFITSKNDPVKNCDLYKDSGCAHVDGPLCDYPNCLMNYDYKKQNFIK